MQNLDQSIPANEAAVSINFNSLPDYMRGAAGAQKALSYNFQGKSIAKMSRDMVMQFPLYMSSSIPTEDAVVIAKSFEAKYSSFVMLVLSSCLNIDSSKYATVSDFLADLIQNDDTPNLMKYAANVITNANNVVDHLTESVFISKEEIMACWYGTDEELTMESINSLYLPNEKPLEKMRNVVAAMEATGADVAQNIIDSGKSLGVSGTYGSGKEAGIQRLDRKQVDSMEPTIISANVRINKSEAKILLGIKAMVHPIPSEDMRSNVVMAMEDNSLAFKIIKWSKGEIKFFRDIVFDITNSRENAKALSGDKNWFAALRNRKKNAKAFVGGGRPVSPITTLIMTDTEVEMVKASTGMDLRNPTTALKLMKSMYLMGFMIYDPTAQIVSTLLDGDKAEDGFAETTIRGLKGVTKDSINEQELIRLFGRR